jgi:hypothetical protein
MVKLLLCCLCCLSLIVPADFVYGEEPSMIGDIPVLHGFSRVAVEPESFAGWLRTIPLKAGHSLVYLYNGALKRNQNIHYRVIDMDIGVRDLQQCADAIIRLRAEYLRTRNAYEQIAFNFTSGDRAEYLRWIEGYRPVVKGNNVTWKKSARRDDSYQNFRKYLDTVFTYAGSYSLSQELSSVQNVGDIQIGDVFIQGGFPGHAILVVDMAISEKSGQTAIMLAQSFMPAQEIHVLLNLAHSRKYPWYIVGSADKLYTPEWTFEWTDLKHFAGKEE